MVIKLLVVILVMMRTQRAYVDPCATCLLNQQAASSIENQPGSVTRVNSPNEANKSKILDNWEILKRVQD